MVKCEKGLNNNIYKALFDGFKTEKIKVCLVNSTNGEQKWYDLKNVEVVNDNYLQDISYLSTYIPSSLYDMISDELEDTEFDVYKFFDFHRNDNQGLREWIKTQWSPFLRFTSGESTLIATNIINVMQFMYKVNRVFSKTDDGLGWDWGEFFNSIPVKYDSNGMPIGIDTSIYTDAKMLMDMLVEEFVKLFLMILNRNVFFTPHGAPLAPFEYDLLPMDKIQGDVYSVSNNFMSMLENNYLNTNIMEDSSRLRKFFLNIFDLNIYRDDDGRTYDIVTGFYRNINNYNYNLLKKDNDIIKRTNTNNKKNKTVNTFIEFENYDFKGMDKLNVEETQLNINYDLINVVNNDEYFSFNYINFYYTTLKAEDVVKQFIPKTTEEICKLFEKDPTTINETELNELMDKVYKNMNNFNKDNLFMTYKFDRFYTFKDSSWKVIFSKNSILSLKQTT